MPDIKENQVSASDDAVQALQAENASLRDRLLRALADAENARRRAERAAAEARQYAIADFAREMLVVADNLRRAIMSAEADPDTDLSLLEGVRATERVLMATFERFGIRKIDAAGARFDPALHEAIMEVDDDTQPPSTVVEVLEDGYLIHDRLLRPARVVVAKRRPSSTSSPDLEVSTIVPDDFTG